MYIFKRYIIVHLIVFALLASSGCASNLPRLKRVSVVEKQQVMNGIALGLGDNLAGKLPEKDILGLSGPMQQFVDKTVAGITRQDHQVKELVKAILSPDQLAMKYEEGETLTASEAFQKHRVNCLSFTTLIVPMLRYLGIKVLFNQVDIPPIWDLQNDDMLVLYQHVNAVATYNNSTRHVIDISMQDYDLYYPQHSIDDRTIQALFYNNRGMEYLLDGDDRQAFLYLRKAIDIKPELPFIWTNLGTLYRRHGKLDVAEIAYRIALEIDPDNLVAISKAGRNYRDMGKLILAGQFDHRAKMFRQNNPYYMYYQARDEVLAGEYEAALDNINAAIRRYNLEHRFYFLQGVIYSALAEEKQAKNSFEKALELTSSQKQQEKYRNKMEKLI